MAWPALLDPTCSDQVLGDWCNILRYGHLRTEGYCDESREYESALDCLLHSRRESSHTIVVWEAKPEHSE